MPRDSGARRLAVVALFGVAGGAVHLMGTQGQLPEALQNQLHQWVPGTYPSSTAASAGRTGRTGTPGGTSSGSSGDLDIGAIVGSVIPRPDPNATVDLGPYGAPGFVWDHGVVYTFNEGIVVGNAGSPQAAVALAAAWYDAWFGDDEQFIGAPIDSALA